MRPNPQTPDTWRWTRRAAASDEAAWRERLASFAQRLAVHGRPGSRFVRLEIYAGRPAPLENLVRTFGGNVARIDADAIAARASAPRRPLLLGRDLGVMDACGSWPSRRPAPRVLLRIGGAMAFGTGEHATTAACLRFLRDEAARLSSGWTALDIGTGSGILAIAAEKFGATRVEAFDNDLRAVRAARANARLNGCSRIAFAAADVLAWSPRRARYPVVAANIYSEILRAAAPAIARAVAPGGCLALSGILRDLESQTLGAFAPLGFALERVSRRGKWATLLLRRQR